MLSASESSGSSFLILGLAPVSFGAGEASVALAGEDIAAEDDEIVVVVEVELELLELEVAVVVDAVVEAAEELAAAAAAVVAGAEFSRLIWLMIEEYCCISITAASSKTCKIKYYCHNYFYKTGVEMKTPAMSQ